MIDTGFVARSDDSLGMLINLLEQGTPSVAVMGFSGCGKHAVVRQAVKLMCKLYQRTPVVLTRADLAQPELRELPASSIVTLDAEAELAVASFSETADAWNRVVLHAEEGGYQVVSCIPYERNAEKHDTSVYMPEQDTNYGFVQQCMNNARIANRCKTAGLLRIAEFVDGNLHVLSYIMRALAKVPITEPFLTGAGDGLDACFQRAKASVEASVKRYEGLWEPVEALRRGEVIEDADAVDLWKIGVVRGVEPVFEDGAPILWTCSNVRLRTFMR